MQYPKLSIITVSLNAARLLEKTISSITSQDYKNIEYVIIDGASSDNTKDVIKSFEKDISNWVSEPDDGIADAMNKGVRLATGDYTLFIHAGDMLVNEHVISEAMEYIDGAHDYYVFNVQRYIDGEIVISPNNGFNIYTNLKLGSCHQGHICKRDLYDRIGYFDTQFNIDMDYEFILRAYRLGVTCKSVKFIISEMNTGGVSSLSDWKNIKIRLSEEQKIHLLHANNILLRGLYTLYWPIYLVYKRYTVS